jgi:hypothetical protein
MAIIMGNVILAAALPGTTVMADSTKKKNKNSAPHAKAIGRVRIIITLLIVGPEQF